MTHHPRSARRIARRISVLAASGLLAAASQAFAALGADEGSVESDRIHMKAELRAKTSQRAFTVHEMQTTDGNIVREFISAQGKVFAVSWRGPSKPDLRALLGDSFDRFVSATQARGPGSHHHLQVRGADLVVQSSGHLRGMFGRAWLPQLVPAGIDVESFE